MLNKSLQILQKNASILTKTTKNSKNSLRTVLFAKQNRSMVSTLVLNNPLDILLKSEGPKAKNFTLAD